MWRMPKNNRTPLLTKRLHLLVSNEQYEFVKNDLNGGIGFHVRSMIDTYKKFFDKEITNLEKEFVDVENKYITIKKRLEELRLQKKIIDDEQKARDKSVQTAKEKLLQVLRSHSNRVDKIPKNIFKIYSDMTGLSVENLQQWLTEESNKQ